MRKTLWRWLVAASLLTVIAGIWLYHRLTVPAVMLLKGMPAVRKGNAPVNPITAAVQFPQPAVITLADGLRVFVIEDHRLPYVQCALALPAGTLMEPKRGLAGITASMILEGTDRHTEPQLAEAAEEKGMNFSAHADLETTTIHCGGGAADFPQMLAMMSETLLHPTFPPDRLRRLQEVNAENWQRTHTNSTYVSRKISGPLFYGDTPYGQPAATLAEQDALSRSDLLGFYRRCYRPNGAVLGVIGHVTTASVWQQVKTALASWREVSDPMALPPPHFPPPAPRNLYIVNWAGASDSLISLQTLTAAQTDPDYIPLLVANRVFGGASSSRLFQNLRETQGFTYGAYSGITTAEWPSLWQAWVSVPYAQTASSVRSVFGELQGLCDQPVPAEELERAKRGLIGSLAVSLDDPSEVLDSESDLVRHDLPADYWQTYCRHVQGVTPNDVQRVAKRYLGDNIQVIVIGPRDKIVAGLRTLGPVKDFDHHGDLMH